MINYVKKKKKDEFPKNKLNIETNNNNNYKQRTNLIQVIKKRELNTSNFDPMKYKRKLMNTQIPKKEIAKNIEPQKKINYTKKNPYQFFGPYNRLIIFGGGFCSRLYNKKYNLNKIYEQYPKKIQKNKPIIEHVNLASYRNIHNVNLKTDKKTNKAKKILIEENNIEHNNNTSTNSNYKIRYNLKSINKNSSYDNQHQKINIREVNHSIKYLKLGKKFGLGIKFAKKEKSRKNENDKKYSKYLINISSKKNPTEKKYKLVFKGINRINKLNNISNPESTHNLEINQTPILTERNEERSVKSERILVKDTIEQFSMENKRIKKFSNLSEIDNILLKFSPIKKDKSFDFQNRSSNYAISSDRIEYNLIKQIPKIEPKKKLVINTNELYILSNKKPKTIIDIKLNNKQKEKEKEKEKEIIIINKEEEKKEEEIKIVNKDEEKKEEEIKIESDIRVSDNNTQNKLEEKKEIENINNNIEINNIEITKEETKENKKQTKTAIDRLAKHKERLKKKNEANKQKENNKSNKIKNLAFELESKMFKKDFESEEEKKIKTEKENNNGAKNETNYNIPIINKKKMKKKVFDEI